MFLESGFDRTPRGREPSPWLFCITVDAEEYGRSRDELLAFLADERIETRPFFIPLHLLPPYEKATRGPLERAEALAASGANLPTHSRMTEADVARVADAIGRARG